MKLPNEKGYVYALGVVGRTYYYEDGIVRAADVARVELAKALASHIQDFVLIVETESGLQTVDEAYIVQVLTSATDIVMEHGEIVAYWVDRQSLVPNGEEGATYALGRLAREIRIRK